MNKPLLISASVLLATLCSTATAEQVASGRCTLTYTPSVNAAGPCTVRQDGDIVNVQGKVDENGQRYLAVIDNGKNEGLLIGAGTFTLANGKLDVNEDRKVVWPNGYVLTLELK